MRVKFIKDIPRCFGSKLTPNGVAEYECMTCEYEQPCKEGEILYVLQMEVLTCPWWAWTSLGVFLGMAFCGGVIWATS